MKGKGEDKTMPFTKHKLTVEDLTSDSQDIGAHLGRYCTAHFAAVTPAGAGIACGSCNAAVAIKPHGFYDKLPATFHGSVVYGNSQVFRGYDPDFNAHFHDPSRENAAHSSSKNEEHAEQVAIKMADKKGELFTDRDGECHLFVELSPCENCATWLNKRDENWNVYYLYDHGMSQEEFARAKRVTGEQIKAITGGARGKKRKAALNEFEREAKR
jgi:deoxycytidylate deaminase